MVNPMQTMTLYSTDTAYEFSEAAQVSPDIQCFELPYDMALQVSIADLYLPQCSHYCSLKMA